MNTNKHRCNDRDLAAATSTARLDLSKVGCVRTVDSPADGVILHSGLRKDCCHLHGRVAVRFWDAYTRTRGDEARAELVEDVFNRGVHAALSHWEAQTPTLGERVREGIDYLSDRLPFPFLQFILGTAVGGTIALLLTYAAYLAV
jgi:hypothetical protein